VNLEVAVRATRRVRGSTERMSASVMRALISQEVAAKWKRRCYVAVRRAATIVSHASYQADVP